MSLALYQIVILAVAAFMLYQGIANYFKRQSGQTVIKLFIRIIVWGGMAIVVAFPSISNSVAKLIGIENNVNAVILAGFLLVFMMIFKLLSAIERLEQQISIVTRQESLKEVSEIKK
ncbi:MAG: DUF2304 domain-containing protein [Candidatus Uhrbacteria bacterium]|nr:DUF2304 domain-containing protein [Candidatus Uhrbacteria bacterium]